MWTACDVLSSGQQLFYLILALKQFWEVGPLFQRRTGGPRSGRALLETQLWPQNWSPCPSPRLKPVQWLPHQCLLSCHITWDTASALSRQRGTLEYINVERPSQNGSAFCPVRLILLLHEKALTPCHFGELSSVLQPAIARRLSRESIWCGLFGFRF